LAWSRPTATSARSSESRASRSRSCSRSRRKAWRPTSFVIPISFELLLFDVDFADRNGPLHDGMGQTPSRGTEGGVKTGAGCFPVESEDGR
jgi:hypothetical protein